MKQRYIPYAFASIVLWSFLAYLGASLRHFPPLFVTGAALTLSGALSLFKVKAWKIPVKTLLVGVGGIFGYHAFYFAALHHAPAVEANLINYLWPLLIVLLTPIFFRRRRLHRHHFIGTFLGFAGAALVITQGHLRLSPAFLHGYFLAFLAALTWACYSLMTKRLAPFPSEAVGLFCLVSGVLSLALCFTDGVLFSSLFRLHGPDTLHLVLLGLGPLGLAFFTWDAALKRGDPRVIGALTYLTPLFSTLILVKLGGHPLSRITTIGMIAIVAGAIVGSLELLHKTPA